MQDEPGSKPAPPLPRGASYDWPDSPLHRLASSQRPRAVNARAAPRDSSPELPRIARNGAALSRSRLRAGLWQLPAAALAAGLGSYWVTTAWSWGAGASAPASATHRAALAETAALQQPRNTPVRFPAVAVAPVVEHATLAARPAKPRGHKQSAGPEPRLHYAAGLRSPGAEQLQPMAMLGEKARRQELGAEPPPSEHPGVSDKSSDPSTPPRSVPSTPASLDGVTATPEHSRSTQLAQAATKADADGSHDATTARFGQATTGERASEPSAAAARTTPVTNASDTLKGSNGATAPSGAAASDGAPVSAATAIASVPPPMAAGESGVTVPATPNIRAQPKATANRQAHTKSVTVQGSLATSVVRRAVERLERDFTECYARSGASGAARPSSLRLQAWIDETGRTRDARVSPASPTPDLDRCAALAMTKLSTVTPDTGIIRVSWTVTFTP